MAFDIGFIKADTHTPEYLMHKYWARKPHNVISECIKKLTCNGDIIIDPFCGSGVVLREGSLLGRKCYGFDLNPVAVLISKVLISPPSAKAFVKAFNTIYNEAFAKYGYLFKTESGKIVKYLSHKVIAKCECGKVVKQDECKKYGKKFICPHCNNQVRFNLETLVDTELVNITVENDKGYMPSDEELLRQKSLSNYSDKDINTLPYNFEFPENRRILAFKGIHTSNFFTSRNYCILSFFANKIWQINDESIRDCALLLMTSTVAQCSRLIANRNNLSTGGPAWSVPGFWVPQEHIESNPFVHFSTRLKKYKKALEKLEISPAEGSAKVILGDSLGLLSSETYSGLNADLIFLDPPYGDSVPYTEFSNIWNSFLKKLPPYDEDISVSDRTDKTQSWKNYGEKLNQYMSCFSKHLTESGKLLITFNNNDMRAWSALISSLQNNGFVCRSVFYQIPAVISSKAQMSINSSYISDVYSVYSYNQDEVPSKDISPLLSHLCFVANSRGGTVSKTVLDREFIIAWLKNNIDYQLLVDKEKIINSVFLYDEKAGIYTIRDSYKRETESLKNAVQSAMNELTKLGTKSSLDSYIQISKKCERFGTMELSEFKRYTDNLVANEKKVHRCTQMTIFDIFETASNN